MNKVLRLAPRVSIAIVMVLVATVFGCGSGSPGADDGPEFERFSDTGHIYTIEDVQATGWKLGKTYDVEGLDGAEAAYVGFWTPAGLEPRNYEVRVYPDHAAAIDVGARFADNASGDDAALNAEDSMWPEGVRDRRIIVGGGSRGSQNPRYGDYVILSNLVILCEGRTPEHSLSQCEPLVALIQGEGA